MNEEQLNEIEASISEFKTKIQEVEQMISDYRKCESDVSKKFLGAAVVKYAAFCTKDRGNGTAA